MAAATTTLDNNEENHQKLQRKCQHEITMDREHTCTITNTQNRQNSNTFKENGTSKLTQPQPQKAQWTGQAEHHVQNHKVKHQPQQQKVQWAGQAEHHVQNHKVKHQPQQENSTSSTHKTRKLNFDRNRSTAQRTGQAKLQVQNCSKRQNSNTGPLRTRQDSNILKEDLTRKLTQQSFELQHR